MRRWTGWVAVVSGLAVAASAAGGAGAKAAEERKDERRVEHGDERKDVRVIRIGGGARLGLMLDDVKAEDVARLKLSEERGALVKEVVEDSPAAKAGLREGDVVVSYQGERVSSAAHLQRLVRETPPGRKVAIEASRAGAIQALTATLDVRGGDDFAGAFDREFEFDVPVPPMPPMPPMAPMPPMGDWSFGDGPRQFSFRHGFVEGRPGRLGLSFQPLSGQLARYFKVEDGALLVTDVEDDGPAARGGVRAGDVIVKLDGKEVTDADIMRRALGDAPEGSDVTLSVQRDGQPLDVRVTPRGEKRARGPRTKT
jgi:serine protease Do